MLSPMDERSTSSPSSGYPLIVIGMHRSGTSLLSKLLHRAGVPMGNDRNVHDESAFFLELNKFLFRAAHADWDYPEPMLLLLEVPELRHALLEHLRSQCSARGTRSYLGWRRSLRSSRLDSQPGPWGWKDPRNTFTLPIWLEVFPSARVLNVYRNGVDVAESLVARERRRVARIHNAVRSCRCLDHERSFELWTEYLDTSLRFTAELEPARVLQVRYESFLEAPESGLRDLVAFLGLELSDAEIQALAADVDPERSFAFRGDPKLVRLYSETAQHPLMQRLEYGDLSCPPTS
jgi:hypothetical protein